MPRILRPGSRVALVRSVVILVFALFALDLGDAWCDSLLWSEAGAAITIPQAGQVDPCAGACVPDCFCCSTSVPAVHVTLVWEPAPSTDVPVLRTAQASTGFVHPPDHVPIDTH
ncbi:MAG: hypothetical protein ACRD1X_07725 [Vicinamibacteria bacterium]